MSFLCRFYRYFIHHGEGEGCLLVRKWGSSAFLRDSNVDVRERGGGIIIREFYRIIFISIL